jgi:hypothetical protein
MLKIASNPFSINCAAPKTFVTIPARYFMALVASPALSATARPTPLPAVIQPLTARKICWPVCWAAFSFSLCVKSLAFRVYCSHDSSDKWLSRGASESVASIASASSFLPAYSCTILDLAIFLQPLLVDHEFLIEVGLLPKSDSPFDSDF